MNNSEKKPEIIFENRFSRWSSDELKISEGNCMCALVGRKKNNFPIPKDLFSLKNNSLEFNLFCWWYAGGWIFSRYEPRTVSLCTLRVWGAFNLETTTRIVYMKLSVLAMNICDNLKTFLHNFLFCWKEVIKITPNHQPASRATRIMSRLLSRADLEFFFRDEHTSVEREANFPVIDFSGFLFFSSLLCAIEIRVRP